MSDRKKHPLYGKDHFHNVKKVKPTICHNCKGKCEVVVRAHIHLRKMTCPVCQGEGVLYNT